MCCNARESDIRVLQVVPSYEHGELILKKYKENISLPRSTVISPGDTPDSGEDLSNKDVVYSEVCVFPCISFTNIIDSLVFLGSLIFVSCKMQNIFAARKERVNYVKGLEDPVL